ncbi:NADH-quinone oxidoreductase subunit H [Collibacillus ludicampi]|jgi:NADH-quinone oxidoreductase subunit H|uniref:NADH-quinone oxidoreductase subunit H n=1 Tax=Collibacillus ludicampi TaxID=2771369 RepID=A0AAV4LDF4_9BACL|nr:NADH-quinone oxidoreductase subunit NuoH [Collibacillus ludicampi]GIM45693.1 NADH-quinone oxidoreductase subunit H [Collibacillus ludicampi]
MFDWFDWSAHPLNVQTFLAMLIGSLIVLGVVLGCVTYAILLERKIIGYMQLRIGPNRVGPWGLFQTIADVLKLLLKEDIIPNKADKTLFAIAPIISYAPAFMVLAVVPFTASHLFTAGLDVGILYYIALSAISVIGIVLGGWASNNKYAIIGALRSAAQMISYEIPLAMSILGVVLMAGSLNIVKIVEAQKNFPYVWYVVPQILGFIVFLIAATAELSRAPFDLPESESELVSGYFTEYSGFRFAFYMLAEYVYLIAMSGLAAALFFGGWSGPLLPGWLWYVIKAGAFIFLMFWTRATMPRIRVDQLMSFSWKVLIPLALLNLLLTATWKIFF